MLDNSKWSKANERFVVWVERAIVKDAISSGYSVIVDNTGFSEKHKNFYKELANEFDAKFEEKFFEIDPKEAIKRDLERPNSVGSDVIMSMYNKYLKPKSAVYEPNTDKPRAIVLDIDGTLAHMNGKRRPYDWDKVMVDDVDEVIKGISEHYKNTHSIILLSGRDGESEELTRKWLKKHDVYCDALYMRKAGDGRKDTIVKKEMFLELVHPNYNVEFIVDDRPSVCRMWREEIGLKVLQVGDPHIEF
jgi:tRNA uridine 5-carbamoylmethylation protein Kti12